MSANPQPKPSQNPNQPSSQSNKPEATQSWEKDSSAKSQSGMKNDPTSQNRDQFRPDATKK